MLLKSTLILILTCVICFSCNVMKKDNNTIVTGTIEQKTFVNKGGKEISNIQDLYFKTQSGETYFIKFMDSKITRDQALALKGQKVSAEVEIIDGMWDVPDDNPQFAQSRTGVYVKIISFTPILNKKDQ